MTVLSFHTAGISHSPESIYRLWADPLTWPSWDSDVSEVRFDGDMTVGAKGWIRPTSGPAAAFVVTELVPNRVLTDTSRLPGAVVTFEHKVEPTPDGSTVAVTISVDGLLSPLWTLILGKSFAQAAERNVNGVNEHLSRA